MRAEDDFHMRKKQNNPCVLKAAAFIFAKLAFLSGHVGTFLSSSRHSPSSHPCDDGPYLRHGCQRAPRWLVCPLARPVQLCNGPALSR
ncbi:hypothetical protein LZ31DRAFT_220414 [Colletotrichum somersetense]|nr:hypothetical protein LZ31DRAFT_220414 [Colletotrichum somersetense]